MDKSSAIANLESRIQPIAKEKREHWGRSHEFEKWIQTNPEYMLTRIYLGQNQENQRAYDKLIQLLMLKTEIIHDIIEHIESRVVPDKIVSHDLIINFPMHLQHWLSSIAEEIDSLLGCSIEPPGIYLDPDIIDGNAIYHSADRRMGLSSGICGESVAFNVGHEYCHCIQDHSKSPSSWFLCKTIADGFADCIGMKATRSYAEKSGNLTVFLTGQNKLWQDIKYFCMRLENGDNPLGQDKFYAVGGTAFVVAEAMHGEQIYREIIRTQNPLEFLLQKLR